MIPVKPIDPDDLSLYAMQLLSPEEMEEMRLQLQHSVEARRILAETYGSLSLFAISAETHDPPAASRQRLMKHLAREPKAVPLELSAVGAFTPRVDPVVPAKVIPIERGAASRVLPWIGWAIAAGLGFETATLYQQRQQLTNTVAQDQTERVADQAQLAKAQSAAAVADTLMATVQDPSALQVSLTTSDTKPKPQPQGRVSYVADKGSLIFLASNLPPLEENKTYELWLIPADGGDAVAAGTFRPDARGYASVVLPKLTAGVEAKAFGVTIEEGAGGSIPTLPIILKGAAS